MLTVIRDAGGRLLAACEWYTRNRAGVLDVFGDLIWVEKLEIGTDVDRSIIPRVIVKIAEVCPLAVGAYWMRELKNGKQVSRLYSRTRLLAKCVQEVV